VLTCASSPKDRRDVLAEVGRVLVAGDDDVDLADGLRRLADEDGIERVVCEGGPRFNADLLRAGLADELCVTVAPQLAGTEGNGIVVPPVPAAGLDLRGTCEQDGELYLRYRIT
jgi:riboflavin biosynthesis pyrimidine reductase